MVSEKDRPILGYLSNIELDLHSEEKGEGYDLIFTFLPNSYFEGTVLKKELHMKDKGILDKSLATKIEWKDGCNPTIKKMKKKKKGKKVNVEVKQDSFFNFFTDIDPENTESKVKPEGGDDDEENDEENDELDKL
jgi:nucleosome assembly protein 1-like 1